MRTLVGGNEREMWHSTVVLVDSIILPQYLHIWFYSYVTNAFDKFSKPEALDTWNDSLGVGYCSLLFYILSEYCKSCIYIIHTRVWWELRNHHDFFVSGKAHRGVIFSCFISSTSSLSLLRCKKPQLSKSSLCFRDRFQNYYLPLHKGYGYNDMACIVFLPAVGNRSSRIRDAVQTLRV